MRSTVTTWFLVVRYTRVLNITRKILHAVYVYKCMCERINIITHIAEYACTYETVVRCKQNYVP